MFSSPLQQPKNVLFKPIASPPSLHQSKEGLDMIFNIKGKF